MNIPKSIADAGKRANELLEQMNAQPEEDEAEQAVSDGDSQTQDEGQTPESMQGVEPSKVPVQETSDQSEISDSIEQRYRTLQGLYRSQREQASRLQAETESLRGQVEDLKRRQEQEQQDEVLEDKSSAYESDYGADMVDMVRSLAQREVRAALEGVQSRFDQVEQAVGSAETRTQATSREMFFSQLSALVPEWREINDSPDFHAWLSEVDPVHRRDRQTALTERAAEKDVQGTAAIFNMFRQGSTTAPPEQPKAGGREALERQVSPSRVGSATAGGAQKEPKVWTQAEVQAFYTKKARGDYRGREQEADRVDAEINKAIVEGRIR